VLGKDRRVDNLAVTLFLPDDIISIQIIVNVQLKRTRS
jgi:hypothetical protein